MRKTLLIAGIIIFVLCIMSFVMAVFSRIGYYHLMDGSSMQYHRLHQRMVVFGAAGIILAIAGAVIIFIRSRM